MTTKPAGKTAWKLAILGASAAAILIPLSSAHSADTQAPAHSSTTHNGGGFGEGPTSQQDFDARNGGPGNGGGQGGQMQGPPPSPEERMVSQLNLSADQQTKTQALFAAERKQIEAIRAQTRQQLMAILTDEQRQEMSQMRPSRGGMQDGQNGKQTQGGMQNDRAHNDGRQNHTGQNGGMQDEHQGPPVEKIAQDLNLPVEKVRAAFENNRPDTPPEDMTEQQRQTISQAIAKELGISVEKLRSVMQKYRPAGQDGGDPNGNDGPPPRGDDDMAPQN